MVDCNSDRLKQISEAAERFRSGEDFDIHRDVDGKINVCYFDVCSLNGVDLPTPHPSSRELVYDEKEMVALPFSPLSDEFRKERIVRGLTELVEQNQLSFESIKKAYCGCAPEITTVGLKTYWDSETDDGRKKLFATIQGIARIALQAESLFNKEIPRLKKSDGPRSITLSQQQCAAILAHSFFCTYRGLGRDRFDSFNMFRWIHSNSRIYRMKLKFLLHYFERILEKMPVGYVTFRRDSLPSWSKEQWSTDSSKLSNLAVLSDRLIEDCEGCLQVDFANKFIGGGVMNMGAVQEEIRFLICPEMLVSILLNDQMDEEEAIFITGAQRFSDYRGYSHTIEWLPYANYGKEPVNKYGQVQTELVAIDACLAGRTGKKQYTEAYILRDLGKALAGFRSSQAAPRPIATGNWGCGAFGGNKQFKAMIQLLAASASSRDVLYCTFDKNEDFDEQLDHIYKILMEKKCTVGQLFNLLLSKPEHMETFDWIKSRMSQESR